MKIQIIGYSGSGKSTLAKELSALYNIPCLHLDATHFYGDWQERADDEQSAIVDEFLLTNKSWVIDGNYSRISPSRFYESDLTIYLNFNRFFCFFSCLKRYFKYKGKVRDSLSCKEKFDKEFITWILYKSRTKFHKKRHLENFNKTKGEKIIFKNRKQVNIYLKKLKENS